MIADISQCCVAHYFIFSFALLHWTNTQCHEPEKIILLSASTTSVPAELSFLTSEQISSLTKATKVLGFEKV